MNLFIVKNSYDVIIVNIILVLSTCFGFDVIFNVKRDILNFG